MPNPTMTTFMPSMPQAMMPADLQTQALSLQRRRAMADAMMQQSLQPMDTLQSSGRYVVPVSPFAAAAKIMAAGMANHMETGLDQTQAGLNADQMDQLRGMFGHNEMTPGNAQDQLNGVGAANVGADMPGAPDPTSAPRFVPGPLSMSGNPGNDFARYVMDPQSYTKTLMANNELTNEGKNAAFAMNGDLPGAQGLVRAGVLKNAEQDRKPGGTAYNYATGQTIFTPSIPANTQPTGINPNGTMTGVKMIPGATGAEYANAAAKTGGEGSQIPTQVFDSNGVPTYISRTTASHGGFQSGTPAGFDAVAKSNADAHAQLQNTASAVPAMNDALRNVMDLTKVTTFGPGEATKAKWKALANAVPGISLDASDAANMAEFKKYISNLSQQAGYGSDAQLQNVLNGLPKDDIPNEAIQKLVPYLMAQNDAIMARANASQRWLDAHGNNPTSLGQFNQQWRQVADPRLFQFERMSPAEQASAIQNMSPAEAQRLSRMHSTLKQFQGM